MAPIIVDHDPISFILGVEGEAEKLRRLSNFSLHTLMIGSGLEVGVLLQVLTPAFAWSLLPLLLLEFQSHSSSPAATATVVSPPPEGFISCSPTLCCHHPPLPMAASLYSKVSLLSELYVVLNFSLTAQSFPHPLSSSVLTAPRGHLHSAA